jgi:hypothetical protein
VIQVLALRDWRTELHRLESYSTMATQTVRCTVCGHHRDFPREIGEGVILAVRRLAEFVCTGDDVALRRDLVRLVRAH